MERSAETDARCPHDGQSLAWHLVTERDPNDQPRTNAAFIGCTWPAELMSAENDARGRAEQILSKHGFHPVFGCDCMPTDQTTGVTETLRTPWEKHVADLLYPPASTDKEAGR